jgi:hypothetical protein
MKITFGRLLLTAVLLLAAGCSDGGDGAGSEDDGSSEAAVCNPAPSQIVSYIEEGLTIGGGGSLTRASYVEVPSESQNSQGWPAWLVAGDLTGAGMDGDQIAVWATAANDAPIMAIDSMAQEFSDWGAAAQPGSPAD